MDGWTVSSTSLCIIDLHRRTQRYRVCCIARRTRAMAFLKPMYLCTLQVSPIYIVLTIHLHPRRVQPKVRAFAAWLTVL